MSITQAIRIFTSFALIGVFYPLHHNLALVLTIVWAVSGELYIFLTEHRQDERKE